jgi:hypothetical protein
VLGHSLNVRRPFQGVLVRILAIGIRAAGFLVFVCFLELEDSPKACGGRERRICLNGAFAENVSTCCCREALSIAGKFSEPEAIAEYSKIYADSFVYALIHPGQRSL